VCSVFVFSETADLKSGKTLQKWGGRNLQAKSAKVPVRSGFIKHNSGGLKSLKE
jgi:hypothetical protein